MRPGDASALMGDAMRGMSQPSVHPATGGAGASDRLLDGLMQRYAAGDAAAFGALYDAISGRLYRFCLRLTRRRDEADDLFQEALLRLHRARASYVPGTTAIPWLFAITRSAYLDRLRHRKRRPQDAVSAEGMENDLAPAPTGTTPESQAMAHAMLLVIERELERLSENNRSAYVLLREEGLAVAEAAAVLGTSGDVVKQRAHRVQEQIRTALRSAGWEGGHA